MIQDLSKIRRFHLFTDNFVEKYKITSDNKINLYDTVSIVLQQIFDTHKDIKESFDKSGVNDGVVHIIDTFKNYINGMNGYIQPESKHHYLKMINLLNNVTDYRNFHLDFDDLEHFMNCISGQYLCIYNDRFTILTSTGRSRDHYGIHCSFVSWVNGIKHTSASWVSKDTFLILRKYPIYSQFEIDYTRFIVMRKLKLLETKLSNCNELSENIDKIESICKHQDENVKQIQTNFEQYQLQYGDLSENMEIYTEKFENLCNDNSLSIQTLNKRNDELSQQNQDILDMIITHIDRNNNILISIENDNKTRIFYIYRYIIAITVLILVIYLC